MKTILLFCIILLGSKFMYSQPIIPDHDINLNIIGIWKEAFADDFNNGTVPDVNKWVRMTGVNACDNNAPPQPDAASWDLPENAYLSADGNLKLDVVKLSSPQAFGGQWCSYAYPNVTWGFNYTSARVISKQFFGYGKYEASIKVPRGKGFYSSFWLYGEVVNYNEIDIFEMCGRDNYRLVHTNVHYPTCDLNSPEHFCPLGHYLGMNDPEDSYCYGDAIDFSEGQHRWELIWEPYKLIWIVDDVTIRTIYKYNNYITHADITDGILHQGNMYSINPYFPEGPMQVIFSLGIDNNYGADNSTQFPNPMIIDWFKYSVHDREQVNINQENLPSLISSPFWNLFQPNQFDPSWNVVVGNDINISTNITIENGSYEIIASNSITLGQGFQVLSPHLAGKVMPDWNFYAHISSGNVSSAKMTNNETDKLLTDSLSNFQQNLTKSNDLINTDSKNIQNGTFNNQFGNNVKISDKIEIKVFPNPNSGKFEIDFNDAHFSEYKVVVFNSLNIIVFQSTCVANQLSVDLSEVSKGLYYLYVINQKENKVFINKLVLQ